MNGFVCVTDNDWGACEWGQAIVISYREYGDSKAQGLRHRAITANWAKSNREISHVRITR